MKIKLHPQECQSNYKFTGTLLCTSGISNVFGEQLYELVFGLMAPIYDLVEKGIADYFQVATVEFQNSQYKLYIIDDIVTTTILFAHEY